jgi:protein involved in polysaccharide export with SLBB domain
MTKLTIALLILLAVEVTAAPQQPAPAPAPTASPGPAPDYRIGAGDALDFKFFYNSELNDAMVVRPDGKVSLPLIGDVTVAGRTVMDIEAELRQRYAPSLTRPEINIAVKTFASQRVFVGGEVNRPSAIPLLGPMTAQEAILDAGGPKRTAAMSKVVLIRRSDSGQPTMQILDMTTPKQPSVTAALSTLRAFDVILLPESKIAKVDRWVDQYIRQVIPISLAGGFSYLIQPIP